MHNIYIHVALSRASIILNDRETHVVWLPIFVKIHSEICMIDSEQKQNLNFKDKPHNTCIQYKYKCELNL